MIDSGTETSGMDPREAEGAGLRGRLCRRFWAARLDRSSAAAGAGVGRGLTCEDLTYQARQVSPWGLLQASHLEDSLGGAAAGHRAVLARGRPHRVLHWGWPLVSRGSLLTSPGQSSFLSPVLEAEGSLNCDSVFSWEPLSPPIPLLLHSPRSRGGHMFRDTSVDVITRKKSRDAERSQNVAGGTGV